MGKRSGSRTPGVLAGVALSFVVLLAGALCLEGGGGTDVGKLAQSAKASERAGSVELLKNRPGEEARERLYRLSADKDPGVALAAVWAIGEQRRPEAREMLVRILRDAQRPVRVRAEAASGLGLFKQTDPNMLVQVLRSEKDPRVRAGAAKGLMAMRNLRTVPALVKGLEDPDERVRRWTFAALSKMMVRRFPYDPKLAPEDQRSVVEQIQHYTLHSAEHDTTHIVDGGHEGHHH